MGNCGNNLSASSVNSAVTASIAELRRDEAAEQCFHGLVIYRKWTARVLFNSSMIAATFGAKQAAAYQLDWNNPPATQLESPGACRPLPPLTLEVIPSAVLF